MAQINLSEELAQRLQERASQMNLATEELLEQLLDQPSYDNQDQLTHLQELVNLVSDALLVVTDDYRILDANTAALSLFGYTKDEIAGQALDILIPNKYHPIHLKHFNGFMEGSTNLLHMYQRQYIEAVHKDGSPILTMVTVSKYHHEETTYATVLLKDMSYDIQLVEQIHEPKSQLHMLAENISDMICLHNLDGSYQYLNVSVEHIIGYSPDELLHKTPYDYVHPDDVPLITEVHTTMLEEGHVSKVVYRFRHKSGHYIWLETRTKAIYNLEGEIKSLITISRDVTDEKRYQTELEFERNLLQGIMDSSPSAIVVVEADGRITYANKRAETVMGIRASKMTERTYDAPAWKHTDYDGNPWPDEEQPFVRVMGTKQAVWDVRHAIEKPDGEVIYLAINGVPMFDEHGEVLKVVFAIEDYTQRKHQQDQLEAALQQAEELNDMKTQFISIVSHEFRTPLAVIMTSTNIINMKYKDITPDLTKRINRIEDQVRHLSRLLEEVTSANRLTAVTPQILPEPIDLVEYFQQLIQDMETVYPGKQSVELIQHTETVQAMLDETIIQHIFVNLVSNAMKYAYPDGQITIELGCDEKQVQVVVSDEGIGIPEKDQPYLFTQFHRAENVGSIMGTGLGLYIAKRAVGACGGSINFESEENVGTSFTVTLPTHTTKQ